MSAHRHQPLISLTERRRQEVVTIRDGKRLPLSELGARRAKSSRGTIEHHERGILGEYAVAKYLGDPDAIDTEIYEGGDPGFDLRYRGKTIDVKTVGPQCNTPHLRVNAEQYLDAQYYVLVHQLNLSKYRVIGYAHRCQVRSAEVRPATYRRYSDNVRIVWQDQLYPL